MSQTAPPALTAPPTAPSTSSPSTFSARMDAFLAWIATFVTEAAALATNVYNNAVDCYNNAVAAAASQVSAAASATTATSAAGASAWVNGGTYALNTCAISQLDFQTYRKITASSVTTTDPKNDATNWVKISGGASAWVTKTAAYNAVAGDRIRADTQTTGAFSVTFPSAPADGDQIEILDLKSYFGINNLTVAGNGKTVMSYTNYVMNVQYGHRIFTYDAASSDWKI